MSRISELIDYFRTCPYLENLWSIGATEDIGVSVILPHGSSQRVQYREYWGTLGEYNGEIIPFPSIYEDYQINCYKVYDTNDSSVPAVNINVLSYEQVQAICDWIAEQDEAGNLPSITGETVISLECFPFVPQIRFVNEEESTVGYFITVRVRYVNRAKGRYI